MGANDGRTQYTPLDNAAPGGDLDFDGLEPGAVLLVSAPMRGHVNQSLIVAETLATRGYDVHFATIGARAQPWVERGAVPVVDAAPPVGAGFRTSRRAVHGVCLVGAAAWWDDPVDEVLLRGRWR